MCQSNGTRRSLSVNPTKADLRQIHTDINFKNILAETNPFVIPKNKAVVSDIQACRS